MLTSRWLHRKLLLRNCYKVHLLWRCMSNCEKGGINNLARLEKSTMVDDLKESQSLVLPGKHIRFTDYDCLGFDLDNTICRYKIGAMIKLEYETLAKFLVEKKGYPSNHLLRPIEDNLDFMLKDGHIIHGSHGTTELTRQELVKYYGTPCRWQATDEFTTNLYSHGMDLLQRRCEHYWTTLICRLGSFLQEPLTRWMNKMVVP
ncbi:hypothetical protein FQR65_LT08248 [Abscondita terminalis]|nr:hypothetical protein FQR65_LT08248 [Abscondita terminalis]